MSFLNIQSQFFNQYCIRLSLFPQNEEAETSDKAIDVYFDTLKLVWANF